ncbi:alkaline phosphatase D family protein [Zobellia laminariae]|uniref:alkaline phosphatase D family protein n=1 Tax=Zobellia laminariae TaxID=248906 RepID=UPI0026F431B4|nr:alkaline phosphatase D family protein [Zobellia laminariae]WKX75655.1 alkaline phosphatase D family protein [Zobellia laminariae]
MTIKRRKFIQNLGLAVPMLASPFNPILAKEMVFTDFTSSDLVNSPFKADFKKLNERVWIGSSFWAVPMEDWEIKNNRLEFSGVEKQSRLHILTHVLGENQGDFQFTGNSGLLEDKGKKGGVGFSVGIKDNTDPNSVKAACYFGKGVSVGVNLKGEIYIDKKREALPYGFDFGNVSLQLKGHNNGGETELELKATDAAGKSITLENTVKGSLDGLVALENKGSEKGESTFWWGDIEFSGSKVQYKPDNSFGPILWAMYTLSQGKLKLTAQLPPVGVKDAQIVELQFLRNGKWIKEDKVQIDPVSFTSIFSIANWNASEDIKYRLRYSLDKERHTYEGVIREEPLDRSLIFGGLTCQHAMGFPYRPLVENLDKSNPDILYFSGDQLYEGNGGYPIKRQPEDKAILNYLGKWYMFGWAFGDVLRNRPSICTPDDHDVYQGNLWGEGGEGITFEEWENVRDAHGGLVQTPNFVNVVNKTQCGHMPEAYDQAPMKSNISTWYTHLVYGKVSFAIVSDRLFKSGPEMVRAGEGRIDHLTAPAKSGELESDNLNFMGQRQLDFLNDWVADWKGANMKVLLSQTLFSNVGTHHGPEKEFLFGDLDSGGWPKSKRDKVVETIRKACTFHINGDQHLPFMVQYSINEPRDGGWTFCTPAISTGYPRWGQPDSVNVPFTDRPAHGLPNTGCYRDGFGNDNYIYAVGNPTDDFEEEFDRYQKAQKKASGYGIVTFDTMERTIKMEAIRFLANLDIESDKNTYPGWPLTIQQTDNDGRRPIGYLPKLEVKLANQLLKIINEETKELVHAMRIKGNTYTPSVYELGKYTLIIGEAAAEKTISGIEITIDPKKTISV